MGRTSRASRGVKARGGRRHCRGILRQQTSAAIDRAQSPPEETKVSVAVFVPRYPSHVAAAAFPVLEGQEREAFSLDVKEHGLLDPIVTHTDADGITWLLDGQNREQGCFDAGMEPRFVEWNGECGDPVSFVRSKNAKRRQLTKLQLAAIGVSLVPAEKAAAKERQRLSGRYARRRSVDSSDQVPQFFGEPALSERRDPLSSGKSGEALEQVAKAMDTNPEYLRILCRVNEVAPEIVLQVAKGRFDLPKAKELAAIADAEERRKAITEALLVSREETSAPKQKQASPKSAPERVSRQPEPKLRLVEDREALIAEPTARRSMHQNPDSPAEGREPVRRAIDPSTAQPARARRRASADIDDVDDDEDTDSRAVRGRLTSANAGAAEPGVDEDTDSRAVRGRRKGPMDLVRTTGRAFAAALDLIPKEAREPWWQGLRIRVSIVYGNDDVT